MLREYRREDFESIRAWVNDSDITNTLSDVFLYPHNVAGYRCYLKSGFREEGRLRQRHYFEGRYRDLIQMGILKSEYEERAGR